MQDQAWVTAPGLVVAGPNPVTGAANNPSSFRQLNGGYTANLLAGDTVPGVEVVYRQDIVAGALADIDIVMPRKFRVTDAWLILRGAGVATTTLQVKNTATAITDAMAASGAAKALVRAATIDSAQWEIPAAGILRISSATGATQPDATVYVRGHYVP